MRFKCLAEGEWVCEYTQKYTLMPFLLFIFSMVVLFCFFLFLLSVSLNHTDMILTSIPIQNPIMSIGFIVTHSFVYVNLCSDIEFVFVRLLEITNLDDLPWARCYYSYSLSTILHKILCQYRTTNILLYTRYRNEYTHSRNVIIILSFWFQVTLIWTCSVCIQSFNMIISINWYCGCAHKHAHGMVYGIMMWPMRKLIKILKIDTAHW